MPGALNWRPKKKIRIRLEEPEPDPPDGTCLLCGGTVPGWDAKLRTSDGRPLFCFGCTNVVSLRGFEFKSFEAERFLLMEPVGGSVRDARVVLYHLEKEIHDRRHPRAR